MRKLFNSFIIIVLSVISLNLAGCSDDDEVVDISVNELPYSSKEFVVNYFPWAEIETAFMEGGEYKVVLSDGTRIEFDLTGAWTDVDAMAGATLPTGFYPSEIDLYISENIPGGGINEISRNPNGYEVDLLSGQELLFNLEGAFIGFD